MSSANSDDRVLATANQILQTLGTDNANDMFRILSAFDQRFSAFSLNRDSGNSSGVDDGGGGGGSSSHSKSKSGRADVGIADPDFVSARDLILKWDSNHSETQRPSFIWTENPEEADDYLQAVDIIQEYIEGSCEADGGVGAGAGVEAREVLQVAMARLEEEFRNLLDSYGEPMDPAFIYEVVRKNKEGEEGEGSVSAARRGRETGEGGGEREEEEEEQEEEEAEGGSTTGMARVEQKSFRTVTLDLLPTMTVLNLSEIAARMVRCGYDVECKQAFIASRRPLMEDSLQRLGLERPTIEDVQKMSWEVLESECRKWVSIMKLGIGVLLHSEKDFCDKVFGSDAAALSDAVFVQVAGPSMSHLLNFAEAVAISKRTPEKIFRLLDMYEALDEILPSIESLFAFGGGGGGGGGGVHADAVAILAHLADAARGTCLEFENAIRRDTPRTAYGNGAVHPLTRYVMNCIKFFADYTTTLDLLLSTSFSTSARSGGGGGGGPLSSLILSILNLLDQNLDAKSKLYRDPALSSLFLMNNLRYMVQKVKDPEVRKLVSDDWIRRHNGRLHQLHNDYRRTAWAKVVACFRDEGINLAGSGSSVNTATRNLLRERFRLFNVAFEETVRTQSTWVVSDPQLCAELQISVTGMILPAYRSFFGRFQHHLDPRNPEKYVKYTPEDVERQLSELFESSNNTAAAAPAAGGSVGRRRPSA